jgi:prevent-host-death family protein
MSRKSWSVQDAKNSFSAVVDAAQRKPQTVTRHGKPAAVVVSAEEFERLQRLDKMTAPTFTEHLLAMPVDDVALERLPALLRDTEF